MSPPLSVLVAGELITDQLFVTRDDGATVYGGARGGGSAFNVAANLVGALRAGNGQVTAYGPGGEDPAGRLAVEDLRAAGVETRGLALQRKRRTRLIFERVGHGRAGAVGGTSHSFGTACPVCGQRDSARARPTFDSAAGSLPPVPPPDVLVLDRLSPARLRLARGLRADGTATVLDLGAVDYLRYTPVVEVLDGLGGFDLLVVSEAVERSLLARAGLPGPRELADAADVGLLVVTRGRAGLTVTGGRRGSRRDRHVPGQAALVTDDAGAGDALLAGLVLGAVQGHDQGRAVRAAFTEIGVDGAARIAQEVVARLPAVLGARGARGHLPYRVPTSDYDEHIGVDTDRLLERAHASGTCPVCRLPLWLDAAATGTDEQAVLTSRPGTRPLPPGTGAQNTPHAARPGTTLRRRTGSARTVDLLLARVLHAAEQDEPARQAAELLNLPGNGYVVGSGGSFAAASYLAEITRQAPAGPFLAALKPADFLRTRRPVDLLVAVSYSGATSDLDHVLEHAADIDVGRLVLLTAARRPRLASRLRTLREDQVISYGPPGVGSRAGLRERGFVSIAGTVMPVVPFVRALHGLPDLVHLARGLRTDAGETAAAHDLARFGAANELLVIGGGWAGPAMVDVEGKFAEADLGPTRLDEPKDFSHGRFISVLDAGPRNRPKQPVLMLSAGPLGRYERALHDTLRRDGHPVALVQSSGADALGGLELLCRVQRFSQTFGEARGIDISRPAPPPPETGLALYRSDARPV